MLTDAERAAECQLWVDYLASKAGTLKAARFQEVTEHIAAIESRASDEKKDKDKFQKDVDEEEENDKATAKDAGKEPKRFLAPTMRDASIVDIMEKASVLRYSPPAGFSGMEPGGGHTAGLIYPGQDPLQNPSSEMYHIVGDGSLGNGPEVHTADGGTAQGNNVTLEVWPQGFVNILIGGAPSGTASVCGMIMSGGPRSEPETSITDDEGEATVVPYRVVLDAPAIRGLMELADQGLDYRRQLEYDGVRYVMARDQNRANPDMHVRVMRSIKGIKDLKDYVDNLRMTAEEVFKTNPQVAKKFEDFMKVAPSRQTVAPAAGIGTREIPKTTDNKFEPLDNPALYR